MLVSDDNNLKIKSFGIKEIDINELKINPQCEAHQQKMSNPQWQAFIVSYKANGQMERIKVDAKTKEIFDGHHRYKASKLLGHKKMKAELVEVNDPIAYIKALNEARRHYTKFQLIEQALNEKPKLQKVVKSHESLGGKGVGIQLIFSLLRII